MVQNKQEALLGDLWKISGFDRVKNTGTIQIAGCSAVQIRAKGQAPTARYGHQAFSSQDSLYIVGGYGESIENEIAVHQFNSNKSVWSKHYLNINLCQISNFSLIRNPSNQAQVYIFGGMDTTNYKFNSQIYLLNVQESRPYMRKIGNVPGLQQTSFNNTCSLPFNQVCGMCLSFEGETPTLYRIQTRAETDSQMGLEQYLKYIKNQQLLSQQLLKKVANLQALQKEIQTYTSGLLRQYHAEGQPNQKVQRQKRAQIENCIQLKHHYEQINKAYEGNLLELKKARRELARVNEQFQGYIQTERD